MNRQDSKLIKKIRQKTQAGFADIRQALEEAQGDEKKALKILKQKGLDKAAGKKSRQLKAGLIDCYIHLAKVGAMIKLQTETDFASRSQLVKNLARDLCLQIASTDPKDLAELKAQPFIKDEELTVAEVVDQAIAALGENIELKDFIRYSI